MEIRKVRNRACAFSSFPDFHIYPLVIYLLVNTWLINFMYIGKFFLGFAYAHAAPEMPGLGLKNVEIRKVRNRASCFFQFS